MTRSGLHVSFRLPIDLHDRCCNSIDRSGCIHPQSGIMSMSATWTLPFKDPPHTPGRRATDAQEDKMIYKILAASRHAGRGPATRPDRPGKWRAGRACGLSFRCC